MTPTIHHSWIAIHHGCSAGSSCACGGRSCAHYVPWDTPREVIAAARAAIAAIWPLCPGRAYEPIP